MHRPRFFFRLMVGVLVAVLCAASAPAVFAGPSIKNARDEIADMRTKLSDAIEQLSDLMNKLIELEEAIDQVAAAIDTAQSPSDVQALVEEALVIKDEQIPVFLEMLKGSDGTLLDFEEEKQSLKGMILALINNKKIKTVNGNRIIRNLNVINSLVQGTLQELDIVEALMEDGDEGETNPDECDPLVVPTDPTACDDVNDALATVITAVVDNDDYDAAADAAAKAMQLTLEAQDNVERILKKKISIILKRLNEADNVLKIEQYKKIAGRRDEVSILLGRTPIVFSAEQSLRLQVFDIHGRLVFERTGKDALAFNGLRASGQTLADGVYLYVLTQDGAASKIGKLILQHEEK
jgi:hypothetical protein